MYCTTPTPTIVYIPLIILTQPHLLLTHHLYTHLPLNSIIQSTSITPPLAYTLPLLKKKKKNMAGVWVFKNGVVRLVESSRRKGLLYTPTNEVINSYTSLEHKLLRLGWERYNCDDSGLLQFHKSTSVDLISLPRDFNHFRSVHMYDIVVKNRDSFRVIDV
ncbi:Flowering-promoting factor 1-like protein 1 [Rhynchospora pubera]|uniref:Flowering-promoting factor 1-like protein 1 n=1 Tax=Rhynchospora pubera TaxID=906938 RepID=A0AAV8E793_9POAL|nr:Flowering-promoting factor 1-like protein 1 [Rhynchospora pubera]